MVDEGVGYALCLDRLINTAGNSNLVFKPLEPALHVSLDIAWKKYQIFSKPGRYFWETLKIELSIKQRETPCIEMVQCIYLFFELECSHIRVIKAGVNDDSNCPEKRPLPKLDQITKPPY